MTVTDGLVSGGEYDNPGHTLGPTTLSEDTGAFTANFRAGLDFRWEVTGTFSIDAAGPAVASGSYIELGFGQPTGRTGTWTCERE